MKYPYIGKSKFSEKTVFFTSPNHGAETPNGVFVGGWAEGNFTNITREYLSNAWGEVKSDAHAEFLIELAEVNGLSIGSTVDNPKSFMAYGSMIETYGIRGDELSNKVGRKQITIPEPPQQNTNTPEEDFEMKQKDMVLSINNETDHNVNIDKGDDGNVKVTISGEPYVEIDENGYPEFKNFDNLKECGDNLIFAPENDFKTARNKAKELRKEMGCSDENLVSRLGFAVGDEVKAVSFNGQVTVKGRLLAITKEYVIIQKPDREQHLFISSWNFKKPKTPEEELRDELLEYFEGIGNSVKYAIHGNELVVDELLEKYNITKK